jgi:glycerol kinase
VIVGLTRYINKNHLARAALEATAYLEAMEKDSGVVVSALKVDGGMVGNELLTDVTHCLQKIRKIICSFLSFTS